MPVVNLRKEPYEVYVGRAGHGLDGYFGNPVRTGQLCSMCDSIHWGKGSTVHCFELYANARAAREPAYRSRVAALHGQVLGCFCSGPLCHAVALERLADALQDPNWVPLRRGDPINEAELAGAVLADLERS